MQESDDLLKIALQLPSVVITDNPDSSLAVLMHFSAAVINGIQPDERVMKIIASAFAKYICNPQIVGEPEKLKSLDECFNLKPKQRVGHPVKHAVDKRITKLYLAKMHEYQAAEQAIGKKTSLTDAAEWVNLNWKIGDKEIEADTLKRYFTEKGFKNGF